MSAIRGKRKRPKNDDLVEGMGDALPVAIAHPSTNQAQSNAQLSEAEMQLVRGFLNDNSELVAQERVGLEVEEIANEHGLSADELVTTAQIVAEATTRLERKKDSFMNAMDGSLKNQVSKIIKQMAEDEQDEISDRVEETYAEFLTKASALVEDATKTIDEGRAEYILSLSPITVIGSTRALALYFKFLTTYCTEKNITGYSLVDLQGLEYTQRMQTIEKIKSDFTIFLRTHHMADHGVARRKAAQNLEANSIQTYVFRLTTAFKIMGIVDYRSRLKKISGEDSTVQRRATANLLGDLAPLFKEAFTAEDAIELIRKTPINSLAELQHEVMLLFCCESGLRVGSIIACNYKQNDHPGILLENLHIKFESKEKFTATVRVLHEKQNSGKISDRKIVLKSDAKYCHLNAAGLLLVFICTLGYTKDSLTDSIANQRVEFKEQYLKFPLFCKIDGTAIMPGELLVDDLHLWNWVSLKTGIPKSLLSNRSARRGNATALANYEYYTSPNTNDQDAVRKVMDAGGWESRQQCSKYVSYNMGPQLANLRLYRQPIEDTVRQTIIESNLSSIFLSDRYQSVKLSEETLQFLEQQKDQKRDTMIEALRQSSPNMAICNEIKGRNPACLRANGQPLISKLGSEDQTNYRTNKAQYDKESNNMRSRITEEGMELRDTISRLRWNETKRTIRVEERYVADRPTVIPSLDYASIQRTFSSLNIPTAFSSLSSFNSLKDIPVEGIPCPQCSPDEEVSHFTNMAEYRKHAIEIHNASSKGASSADALFYCHADGCSNGGIKAGSFREHNRRSHGWSAYCVNCERKIPQELYFKHQKQNESHVIRLPWEFAPFVWPSVETGCDCARALELPQDLSCVTDMPEIILFCTDTEALATVHKKSLITKNPRSKKEVATECAERLLNVSASNFPECVKQMLDTLDSNVEIMNAE